MQHGFGSGCVWGTATYDGYGNAITSPTAVLLGVLQDASIDIGYDVKLLSGTAQFPVAAGRGKGKITGKAKFGQFNGLAINSLFFGQTMTSAILSDVNDTTGAIIPGTPFTITPTIPGAGTWGTDLGVRDSNGIPMTRVASGPTTGQYSVSAGAYVFASADTGKTVFISFQYSATSTVAKTSTVMNLPMGNAPTFRCDFFNSFGGKGITLSLFACMSNKLHLATKADDFLIPEFDFEAYADPAGRVLQWGTAE
jgi:hypothetical protein